MVDRETLDGTRITPEVYGALSHKGQKAVIGA